MRRLTSLSIGLGVWLCVGVAAAEGTVQLGANQDLREGTPLSVDIITAGEVINVVVGSDRVDGTGNYSALAASVSPVAVTVTGPGGSVVPGSPFTVSPGSPGWLQKPDQLVVSGDVGNPLRITTTMVGTYTITFDNTGAYTAGTTIVVDPFDITVTPDTATAYNPATPPDRGRLHTQRWPINAHTFAISAATNASFFVLVPTTASNDFTWLLKFSGMAGFIYEVQGNDVGLPAPHSGFSEDETIINPLGGVDPQYEVYLDIPKVARGGNVTPVLSNFDFQGPSAICSCAIANLASTFTFTSDVAGVYELVIDIDGDGLFDPTQGDVLLKGTAQAGANSIAWDGNDGNGVPVPPGTYPARLSVRLGEFHFVGRDIETSRPGLRMFGVDSTLANPVPQPTQMFWNDSRINGLLSPSHATPGAPVDPAQASVPTSTVATGGLSSAPFADATQCGINSHCWGNFESNVDPRSPGNYRYIDTYTFFTEAVDTTVACVVAADGDDDDDGLTNAEECTGMNPTDPNDPDTDGDGLSDGVEQCQPPAPLVPPPMCNNTDPNNPDSDGDGLSDGIEDTDKNGGRDPGETDPNDPDTDEDGLTDGEEDRDKDGMRDPTETDPLDDDTDDDGLLDGVEDKDKSGTVGMTETDPLDPDSDDDEILDGTEDRNHDGIADSDESNPLDPDTDDDGLGDGIEDADKNGTNDAGETSAIDPDSDDDGLQDGEEDADKDGTVDTTETDPREADTDGDALSDGVEKGVDAMGEPIADATGTDPLDPDSDDDGLKDGEEDENLDGVRNKLAETDPNDEDTDDDGLLDGEERGKNADGTPIEGANNTDPKNPDTDGDCILDGKEDANTDGKYDKPAETNPALPGGRDSDGDGLPDGEDDGVRGEDRNCDGKRDPTETDPRDEDTDDGGEPDGSEVTVTGHDPLEPSDDRDPFVGLFGGGCKCSVPGHHDGLGALAALLGLFGWAARRSRRSGRAISGG